MENRTDKNSYTILFAIGMVLVVGALLAYASEALKPKITENKRLEIQQNILYAMGVNDNEDGSVNFIPTNKVASVFSKYIKKQLVIEGDKVIEDDNAYLIDLKKEEAKAADPNYTRRLPLFVGEKDGQTFYIIPMRGKGLWDAIWGYMAVDKNLIVDGVYFDHKGETPGLGANINQRFFMDDFKGEEIMNGNSFVGIDVTKGNNDPKNDDKDDHEIDALAGATITSNGVTAMIKKGVGMYIPYLKTLKN
ncbi:Na(+)-translocating NADH-quinone reductase subunit C [Yeosuana marina]|uniref:Na(+)-translocating NADH-quinone reductase subunit C n=1 Tax=Yeosuana marina TaxID=1565536 RepID=UPI001420C996|nr:Na(+)-translocating NADH-quinone reductase subunit C [Yeosuana marina]